PTVGPSPLTRLNTPAGTPASSNTSASSRADRGATSEGLSTMVQPVARAGAILQASWLIGQFQGAIRPQTPIGSFTTRVLPMRSSSSDCGRALGAAAKWRVPEGAGAYFDRLAGAPTSEVRARANSSLRR